MENGGGGGGGVVKGKIRADDVIAKLKDDGDFDRIRLKIIRKLKENEELRHGIMSVVKQSAALNRPGFENMKPRQLSDAIHEEVGDKVMNQISDGIWEIIRSGDGLKSEIRETVQSVYYKLLKPKGNENMGSSSNSDVIPVQKGAGNDGPVTASVNVIDGTLTDNDPKEPPGFSRYGVCQNSHHEKQETMELPMPRDGLPKADLRNVPKCSQSLLERSNIDPSAQPGPSTEVAQMQPRDGSDEDPDVPPGFG
ncbi:hypothetical protein RJ640_027201 [Escallonia rubra]|uniref:Uncharacterized protein n=1 Tax=Escallonia rubra TaxID=112253 RepID=A0AA88RN25_9ASTE|nr:hypothetical protein RJ640_027201 [Escallonia rubra]